ncbi:hypothetical protein FBZ82_105309 [Azospirillum brasilense]|uniref:Uncharacterized protein n=2 Tax=Azospirillum TaxID=191 RepID=A0A4D8QZI0_AZOBR|nr:MULTISPECIES: hypothetical protein [Azospirillum]AWJ83948.1 hypothetical protein TSH58p_10705 [Azospirillum sp. TSH58]MBK3731796.1 hypothetical protein [Azospirillum brasilense]PWC70732.1 hypothetical protein TSH58_12700 [Azospirillum sp. TSH58]QCO15061.1 hypothetical protein D3869_07415 [Azospirillum brasilense]TWA69152.1 hypothetical protein FBZ82_105309 [Azospirillum brasilense]
MIPNPGTARRELANLGNALTLAERGLPRHTPAELMAWLVHALALCPGSIGDALLFEICGTATDAKASDAVKIAQIRKGWAAVVRAQFRLRGLTVVGGGGDWRACAA